jgi:DNA polymerase (family X)
MAGHPIDMALLLEREGLSGIDALPGIGPQITRTIAELARTGRWAQLQRLRGEMPPERLFTSIPGIGPELARRIHDALDVDTLEELEAAAHDGRLAEVPGL